MNPRPCATPHPLRAIAWALFALTLLPCLSTPAQAAAAQAAAAQADAPQGASPQADDDRGLAPGPVRHVLVKAVGQGVGADEAEQDALHSARLLAAKHYAALGGGNALDLSPQGMRVIAAHSTPPMGLASVRAVVLVELRLKPLPEPPPAALALPVLQIAADSAQVQVQANRACEVMIAVDSGADVEDELLPGGGGAAYRLAPGKPMQQSLPKFSAPASLRVLACTGGLAAPAIAPTLDEALGKARAGKPKPTTMQGVVSECVEVKSALPGVATKPTRSMRQKGSQSPVNMTGAAGREGGFPVPGTPGKDLP